MANLTKQKIIMLIYQKVFGHKSEQEINNINNVSYKIFQFEFIVMQMAILFKEIKKTQTH